MLFIFDMGGVVTKNAPLEGRIASELKISAEEFRAAQKEGGTNYFSLLTCGKISSKEFWKKIGERLSKKIECDFWEIFFKPELNCDVAKMILPLKKKGRVVCGTNTIQSHYDCHTARGDYAFFDKVYASQKMGVEKPEKDFWKMILHSENEKASETFFTDDREENVAAAAALGIFSCKFENAESLRRALKEFFRRKKMLPLVR